MATPMPSVDQHGQVVFSVAKGHAVFQRDAEVVQNGIHSQILSSGGRDDVQKIGVPAGGLEVGSAVQQQVLLLPG